MLGEKVEESVSAADANRKFSHLLQGVRQGRSYLITSHGKPVARICPADDNQTMEGSAREALLARLRDQPVAKAARWTRDELYEDGQ
ncbi:MAG: type II toxin-antitoxin system prevent-host-death family antitoxin [Acidobacteriaceae bacterium]